MVFFYINLIIFWYRFHDCLRHEDIRDAIMSLVNIFRDNTDKLERHEARERQLGEQLKKSFSQVEKKQKSEETSFGTVLETLNNISRRLETIENIVLRVRNLYNKLYRNNLLWT